MLNEFGFVGIFALVAVAVPASMLLIPYALTLARVKPHRPDKSKTGTYECGMPTIGGSWVRFNFRYYFFALLFVVLDVTVVFLYPWAVHFRELRWLGFTSMIVFVGIISVGLLYAWRKRALEWS